MKYQEYKNKILNVTNGISIIKEYKTEDNNSIILVKTRKQTFYVAFAVSIHVLNCDDSECDYMLKSLKEYRTVDEVKKEIIRLLKLK